MQELREKFMKLNQESKKIFSILQKQGEMTKNDLISYTGLKLSTLNRTIEPLLTLGLIIESGTGSSSGGRKPSLFSIRKGRYGVIGIDISRSYSQIIITDLAMNILYEKTFYMNKSHSPSRVVELLIEDIHHGIAHTGLLHQNVVGVGIGCVGPIDRENGIILNPTYFEADGWNNVPIQKMIEDATGYPTIIDNGANLALLGDALFGIGKNFSNIALLICGIGIRTSALTSKVIVRSMNDREDAFAHMIVDADGEMCTCGNFGCVEAYASGQAILKKFIASIKKGRSSIITKSIDRIELNDICKAADENDRLAVEIISEAATILGTGIANYINLLNPGLLILSGPLIRNSKLYYKVSTEIAFSKISNKLTNHFKIVEGGIQQEKAISYGAAVYTIEELLI